MVGEAKPAADAADERITSNETMPETAVGGTATEMTAAAVAAADGEAAVDVEAAADEEVASVREAAAAEKDNAAAGMVHASDELSHPDEPETTETHADASEAEKDDNATWVVKLLRSADKANKTSVKKTGWGRARFKTVSTLPMFPSPGSKGAGNQTEEDSPVKTEEQLRAEKEEQEEKDLPPNLTLTLTEGTRRERKTK